VLVGTDSLALVLDRNNFCLLLFDCSYCWKEQCLMVLRFVKLKQMPCSLSDLAMGLKIMTFHTAVLICVHFDTHLSYKTSSKMDFSRWTELPLLHFDVFYFVFFFFWMLDGKNNRISLCCWHCYQWTEILDLFTNQDMWAHNCIDIK